MPRGRPGERSHMPEERLEPRTRIETLARLAAVMEVEINIDIRPRGRRPKLATKRAQTDAAVADFESQDAAVSLSAV